MVAPFGEQIIAAKDRFKSFCIMCVGDDAAQEGFLTDLLSSDDVGLKLNADFFFAHKASDATILYKKLLEIKRQPTIVFLSSPSEEVDLVGTYHSICAADSAAYMVLLNWDKQAQIDERLNGLLMQYVISGEPTADYLSACISDRMDIRREDIATFREDSGEENQERKQPQNLETSIKTANRTSAYKSAEVISAAGTGPVEHSKKEIIEAKSTGPVEWAGGKEDGATKPAAAPKEHKKTEVQEKRASEKEEWGGEGSKVKVAAKEKQSWSLEKDNTTVGDGKSIQKAKSEKMSWTD